MTDGDDTRAKMIEVAAEASYLQNPFVGGSKFGPPIVTPWSRDIPTADWHVEKATRVVDALIAAFPVLTTEPNETADEDRPRMRHLEWLVSEIMAASTRNGAGDRGWWRRRAITLAKEMAAVLAVAPTNPTDDDAEFDAAWQRCGLTTDAAKVDYFEAGWDAHASLTSPPTNDDIRVVLTPRDIDPERLAGVVPAEREETTEPLCKAQGEDGRGRTEICALPKGHAGDHDWWNLAPRAVAVSTKDGDKK